MAVNDGGTGASDGLTSLDRDLLAVLDDEYGLSPFAPNADAARYRVRVAVRDGARLAFGT